MTPEQLKAIACDRGVHPVTRAEPLPDGGLRETCDRCGHVETFAADQVATIDDTCVADDSTECDCSRCTGERAEWERWQGWEDDIGYTADSERDDYDDDQDDDYDYAYSADDDLRDGPCIGADCLHHYPMHSRAECFTEEEARAYYTDQGVYPATAGPRFEKRARRRVRMARKRRRGWA